MPATIYLLDDGYKYPQPSKQRNILWNKLPSFMNPSRSKYILHLQVKKMPSYLNRTRLVPPHNFQINDTFILGYKCGPTRYVSPSLFLDPSDFCSIALPEEVIPKCCVSFSVYYNESLIPIHTCACGYDRFEINYIDATAPANLFLSDALPIPFENRTNKAIACTRTKHLHYLQPEPCPDFSGASIHWHVKSNHANGWNAKITLFNWGEIDFSNWFVVMQFGKVIPGFETMYSFNGTSLNGSHKTILCRISMAKPERDPRVTGRQEPVIFFTREKTSEINIVVGGKFPTRVFFNGGECTFPVVLPYRAPRISLVTSNWGFCFRFL
ncbi:hypothetical protein MKX01_042576 [Papaver californicum]|nr:hypothetical protein MKX01_042576 [Papaver californicum]